VRAARLHSIVQVRLSLLPRCSVTVQHPQYPLACVTCACSHRHNLRKHERVHHGMRPEHTWRTKEFRCEVEGCGRGFRCVAASHVCSAIEEEYCPPYDRHCHPAREPSFVVNRACISVIARTSTQHNRGRLILKPCSVF
jgi:hypothetical protein